MKKFLSLLVVVGLFVTLGCGGGTGTDTGEGTEEGSGNESGSAGGDGSTDGGTDATPSSNLPVDQEDKAILMMQAVIGSLSLLNQGDVDKLEVKETTPVEMIDCGPGGTATMSASQLLFDNCTMSPGEGESVTIDGSISLSEVDDITTVTYDVSFTFTFDGDPTTFTITGSVSMGDKAVTFNNLTGTFKDGSYSIKGKIAEGTDDTFYGNITISVGAYSATCVFNGFDPDSMMEEDFADACGF